MKLLGVTQASGFLERQIQKLFWRSSEFYWLKISFLIMYLFILNDLQSLYLLMRNQKETFNSQN